MRTNTSATSYEPAGAAGIHAGATVSPGIYVHVPFCSKRCDYCAFATWTDREHLWERYVDACCRQVEGLSAEGWGPASSVFFGGGTPSLVPAPSLVRILSAIVSGPGLVPGAEVTVECNPETLTSAKLGTYREGGVNRLSFGAQSMVPHVLESLGRRHSPGSVREAVRMAEGEGFSGRFNIDLIFGAAGESVGDWRRTVEEVLDMQPAHVSAYALTVEPGTPLARDPHRFPVDDDQADKYLLADTLFRAAGLGWYEISNFARAGAECAHNLLYWRQGEYAGIGCAAHGHRALTDGGSRRWWNVRTPERYCALVENGGDIVAAQELLTAAERDREAMMLALRTRHGVPAAAVPGELFEAGLLEIAAGERAVLTVNGRLLANEVSLRLRPVSRALVSPGDGASGAAGL